MNLKPHSINYRELIKKASKLTNLKDFGDPLHLNGLEKLCYSLQEEAQLNTIGKIAQHSRLSGILINRLRFQKDLKDYPEIKKELIASPVVIIGLPRTGSTMTHRLLSADSNHTSMFWW